MKASIVSRCSSSSKWGVSNVMLKNSGVYIQSNMGVWPWMIIPVSKYFYCTCKPQVFFNHLGLLEENNPSWVIYLPWLVINHLLKWDDPPRHEGFKAFKHQWVIPQTSTGWCSTPTWLLICSSLSTAQSNIEVPCHIEVQCLLQLVKLEVFCVGALKCWSRIATGWPFPMPPSNHSIATCPNGGVALPISAVSGTVSSKLGTGAATCERTGSCGPVGCCHHIANHSVVGIHPQCCILHEHDDGMPIQSLFQVRKAGDSMTKPLDGVCS